MTHFDGWHGPPSCLYLVPFLRYSASNNGTPSPNHNPENLHLQQQPHVSVRAVSAYCIEADDISALFLTMTHESTLLLAANQTPLMLSAICYRQSLVELFDVEECRDLKV